VARRGLLEGVEPMNISLISPLNNIEEQEKELTNVVELRSITGGKQPPEDGNYFTNMAVGTIFLVRNKQDLRDPNLHLFYLRGKTEKAVILSTPTIPQLMYQIPMVFCGKFDLFETIGFVEETQEQQETEEIKDE